MCIRDRPKKEEKDAVPTPETNVGDAPVEEQKDSGDSEKVVKEIRETDEKVESDSPIKEITDEEDNSNSTGVDGSSETATTSQKQEEIQQEEQTQKLPENIENLGLTGTSSNHTNATGNSLDNRITGTYGNNILDGGTGDDIYIVTNSGDTVTDNLGNEYDTQIAFGSIIKVTPINSKDIDELPILTVNSKTGSGAVLKANLDVRPETPQGEIKQVIDCINT